MTLAGQVSSVLTGYNGYAFHGETFGEEYGIPNLDTSTGDKMLTRNLAQHVPGENRALQADRNLCMPTHQGNTQLVTGLAHLRKNVLYQSSGGPGLWQQQCGQEPTRRTPHGRDVVGVHRDGIVPNGISRKRDGIGFRNEEAVTHVNHGGVLAYTRPNEHTRICGHVLCQESSEEGRRKLAGRERREAHTARLWRPTYCRRSVTFANTRSAPCASSLALGVLPESTPMENMPKALPAWISIAPSPTMMARSGVVPRQSSAAWRCAGWGFTCVTRLRGTKAWQ